MQFPANLSTNQKILPSPLQELEGRGLRTLILPMITNPHFTVIYRTFVQFKILCLLVPHINLVLYILLTQRLCLSLEPTRNVQPRYVSSQTGSNKLYVGVERN